VLPMVAGLTILAVLAVGSVVVLGQGSVGTGGRPPTGTLFPTADPSKVAVSTPGPSARPLDSQPALDPDERAAAAAYLALAGAFDDASTDLQISDPLAEFDLVGARLIDLLDRTRADIVALPRSGQVAAAVRDLGREMAATTAMLRAIDPHGPRDLTATQYREALDYWIDHVKPATDSLRATLGLPATPGGDLRL
jgi:hypothetical protein